MKRTPASVLKKWFHLGIRAALSRLPRAWRFALFRAMVDCDPQPDPRLELKIADTQDELEACFRLLHDAYVASGFMQPDPSGLRVTVYHALPTTTTLCAKVDGQVVGTLSMIRDGVFGFPLQSVFDLTALRAQGGNIAEISALAIAPAYRKTGGKLLFPLMKFMYEYAREYFDTRHLVIAVNPNKIEMYESLLFFQRLHGSEVDRYDFANGAPAVGASLDLVQAPELFRQAYAHRRPRKDLHHYFTTCRLPNIRMPGRRFHTTNDPVMTPAMLAHFFQRRTHVFDQLDDRKRLLLRSIYDLDAYAEVLPTATTGVRLQHALRQHQRFSIRCPAQLSVRSYDSELSYDLQVVDISMHGFQAECPVPLPEGTQGRLTIDLGAHDRAELSAVAVRRTLLDGRAYYGFSVCQPGRAWQRCVRALSTGRTHADLDVTPVDAVLVDPAGDGPTRQADLLAQVA